MAILERASARVMDVHQLNAEDRGWFRDAVNYMDSAKSDWWANIDPLTLDLGDSSSCICGQNGLSWRTHFLVRHSGQAIATASERFTPLWLEEIAQRMPSRDREPLPTSTRRPLVASEKALS